MHDLQHDFDGTGSSFSCVAYSGNVLAAGRDIPLAQRTPRNLTYLISSSLNSECRTWTQLGALGSPLPGSCWDCHCTPRYVPILEVGGNPVLLASARRLEASGCLQPHGRGEGRERSLRIDVLRGSRGSRGRGLFQPAPLRRRIGQRRTWHRGHLRCEGSAGSCFPYNGYLYCPLDGAPPHVAGLSANQYLEGDFNSPLWMDRRNLFSISLYMIHVGSQNKSTQCPFLQFHDSLLIAGLAGGSECKLWTFKAPSWPGAARGSPSLTAFASMSADAISGSVGASWAAAAAGGSPGAAASGPLGGGDSKTASKKKSKGGSGQVKRLPNNKYPKRR